MKYLNKLNKYFNRTISKLIILYLEVNRLRKIYIHKDFRKIKILLRNQINNLLVKA